MINREMKTVSVVSFTTGTDDYGQKRKLGSTLRDAEMVVKIFQQADVDNVKYVDVEKIGLTKDKDITDANQVIIDGVVYQVLFIIPSSRYNQVLMKRA